MLWNREELYWDEIHDKYRYVINNGHIAIIDKTMNIIVQTLAYEI